MAAGQTDKEENSRGREKTALTDKKQEITGNMKDSREIQEKETKSAAQPRGHKKKNSTDNPKTSRCPHTNQYTVWKRRSK
jgi:hypothetical protein